VSASVVCGAVQANAQNRIVDEVKVGVMAHDVTLGGHHVEGGADINAKSFSYRQVFSMLSVRRGRISAAGSIPPATPMRPISG